jgi:carbonic anhydrase
MKENINALKRGYRSFKEFDFKANEMRFKALVENGQNPKALFIGCSDSRVVPEIIMNTQPGDLFITRNIGNFVPPYKKDEDFHATAAAIEYAVSVLEVKDIIVCGHSHCGAIDALFEPPKMIDKLEIIHTLKWLELGYAARDQAEKMLPHERIEIKKEVAQKLSVIYQLENLLTYPSVKRKVYEKNLFLHGWYYEIENGSISYYDETMERFEPL